MGGRVPSAGTAGPLSLKTTDFMKDTLDVSPTHKHRRINCVVRMEKGRGERKKMKLKSSLTAQNMHMMFYDLPEEFSTCGLLESEPSFNHQL